MSTRFCSVCVLSFLVLSSCGIETKNPPADATHEENGSTTNTDNPSPSRPITRTQIDDGFRQIQSGLNNSGGVQAQGVSCFRTLRSFGAIGNGQADDTAAINRALNTPNCDINGEGRLYRVTREIVVRAAKILRNTRIFQANPQTGDRLDTLIISQRYNVALVNVQVHRGFILNRGHRDYASGILVERSTSVSLNSVRVTGNGRGAGIRILDSVGTILRAPVVENMGWRGGPQYERILGIYNNRSNFTQILYPRVLNLYQVDGTGRNQLRETDGITFAGSRGFKVIGAYIRNVAEGIDVTGTDGNRDFEIRDSLIENADSFAFKFANSAVNGKIYNCEARAAGYAGFVFSGPAEQNVGMVTRDIQVYNSRAINTGENGRWSRFTVAGFLVLQGAFYPGFPKDIRIFNSASRDPGPRRTTKYGFLSQVSDPGNFLRNVDSSGHLIEGARGF